MKTTLKEIKNLIHEEVNKILNEENKTEVVTIGINSSGQSHKNQIAQINKVIDSYNNKFDTVYTNVVKTSKGSFISVTVPKKDIANLVQYLRNVKSKVDGWEILS